MADDNSDESWLHWGTMLAVKGAVVVGAVVAAPWVLGNISGGLAAIAPAANSEGFTGIVGTVLKGISDGASGLGDMITRGISAVVAGTSIAPDAVRTVAGVTTTNTAAFADGTAQVDMLAKTGGAISSGASAFWKNISDMAGPYKGTTAAVAGTSLLVGDMIGRSGGSGRIAGAAPSTSPIPTHSNPVLGARTAALAQQRARMSAVAAANGFSVN